MPSYQHRLLKVIDYIEAHLDEALDVDQLCEQVYLSKFHFHRLCSNTFGMPLMSLVRLLKLKRAAYQLAYRNNLKVIDIALINGYESHEAFSRTFKKHFLTSPLKFRQLPNWDPWHTKYEPILKLRTEQMRQQPSFNVDIVEFTETKIAKLQHRGAPAKLGQSITKFIEWRKLNKLPPAKSRTFNLIYDDPHFTEPDQYKFDLCCAVESDMSDVEYGISTASIPKGKCAKIRFIGSDDAIGVAVNFLYSDWLEQSNNELRDFPLFFERVSFFPEVPEHEMITDIYLPIVWSSE